ncbi:beta-propeller fold lactonase family protein [Wenzhouxiangella sp. EGI_FJ10409]|uniref:beta-propeller fold lactonase family protein n=1 Tax=Wenzhouxiangella sp. EGI_FJ10409 TaxID=3243767 RepID=UPI0035DD1AAC
MSYSECRPRAARPGISVRACAAALLLGLLAPTAGLAQTLTKTAPDEVTAGERFEYEFTIDNDTGDTLADVFIVDDLPEALSFVGVTAGDTDFDCTVELIEEEIGEGETAETIEFERLSCEHMLDLPEGETALAVEVAVDPDADAETIENAAGLFAEQVEEVVSEATAETEVVRDADLELIERSLPTEPVTAETTFDYGVTLINNGPSSARDVSLATPLPYDVSLVSSSPGWDCRLNTASRLLDCRRDLLAPSEDSMALVVSLRAPRNPPVAGEMSGDVSLGDASIESTTPDSVSGNEVLSDVADVTIVADWNLSLSKTASDDPIVPGLAFQYDIAVSNTGPSDLVGDLRPLLGDEFDGLLVSDSASCEGLSSEQPCWTCGWRESPEQRQVLDTAQVTSGIGGAWQPAVSPDRRHVYVTGRFDDALAKFDRETLRNGDFGTLAADAGALEQEPIRPRALDISADGRFLASATWLAAGETGTTGELQLFERDPASGALTLLDRVEGPSAVTALVFSPDGRFVYLADAEADAIKVYARDSEGLTLEQTVDRDENAGVLLAGVADLVLSPDGDRLYAAAPGDSAITAFGLNPSSGVATPLAVPSLPVEAEGENIAVEALAFSPDGGELAAGGGSALVLFEVAGDGSLTLRNTIIAVEQPPVLLAGIAGMIYVGPDELFVIASEDRAISRLARSEDSGELILRRSEPLPTAGGDDEILIPNGIAREPGGENLYVTAALEPVDGLSEPSLSAVVTYAVAASADCGISRPSGLESGDIVDRALTLPAGQELVVTVFTRLEAGATTDDSPLVNTATLDDGLETLSDIESVGIIVATAVDVEHAVIQDEAVPGEDYSFEIAIHNQGPIDISGAQLAHIFDEYAVPGDAGFEPGQIGWSCSAEGNACCNPGGSQQSCGVTQPTERIEGDLDGHVVDLGAGSSLVFTTGGRVHPASNPGGNLTNSIELLMPDGVDALDENALSDTLNQALSARADLWLTKERVELIEIGADDTDWPAGTELVARYAIRTGNRGPSAASGALLEDLLDADDALLADDAAWNCSIVDAGEPLAETCCGYAAGSCQAAADGDGPLSQTVGLAPGARLQFDLYVPVDVNQSDGTLLNTASIAAPTDVVDPDPLGASVQLTTRLAATAELDITKATLAGDSITPGEEVSFEITVTNAGPDDVPVVVEDLLPEDMDNATWTCDATTPTPGDLIFDAVLGRFDLVAASDVLASPDGRHVYVSAAGGPGGQDGGTVPSAVAVFERNIVPGFNFGELLHLETEADGVEDPDDAGVPVEGLGGAGRMTFSPDARHLYVAASEADAVAVFRREHVSGSEDYGRLSFAESRSNGSQQPGDANGPVSGLDGASDVAVSADGEHVYVLGFLDQAVTVFRRDSGTGTLEFQGRIDAFDLAADGFDGLWGPIDIALSPDDRHVVVTGSGTTTDFGGTYWAAGDDGQGGQRYAVAATVEVEEDEPPPVRWLTASNPVTVPDLSGELRLAFDHRHDFETGGGCADVGVLEISTDGGESWSDIEGFGAEFVGNGYDGQQSGASHPLSGRFGWCGQSAAWGSEENTTVTLRFGGALAAGDRFLLRWGLGAAADSDSSQWLIDRVEVFDDASPERPILLDTVDEQAGNATATVFERRSDSTGVGFGDLDVLEAHAVPGAADAAVMDGQGENLYVGSAIDRAIYVYRRDADTGELESTQTLDSFDADAPFGSESLAGLATLAVSGDGEHLVAGAAAADTVAVFRRQPFSGTLVPMQRVRQGDFFDPSDEDTEVQGGVAGVAGLAFSSDGQHVFSAAQPGQVGVFRRLAPDPTFGFLEAVFDEADDGFDTEAEGLLGARAASLSDNGRFVYTAASGQIGSMSDSGALVVLERDPAAADPGRHLRFRQALRDDREGVVGLDGAVDVLSVDEDIYVVSERDHAIAHFRQLDPDGPDAEVEFVQAFFDDVDADGLDGAAAVAINPAGTHVYVASRFDHSVSIFRRDEADGTLEPLGVAGDGIDGASGMLGANALAVSTDGRQLYVAARQSDAVVVFDIDGDELVFRQSFFDGTDGAVLTSPTGIAVSRDDGGSEHVLVTSLDGDAVTVLDRATDASIPDLFGRVSFHSVVIDGSDGADALRGPRDIVVDPDNDRVYVVSELDNALVILDRNTSVGGAQFGRLTPLEIRRQGVRGVIGLSSPYGLAVSDGARRNIYTASLGSQSVAAFVRRAGSSCAAAGSGNISEEVFLAANGTVRFFITGTVAPGATGTLSNEASISVADDVDNTGNQTSFTTDPVELKPFSELSVSKTNDRLSVTAGERQTYRIAIDNTGPSSALGVGISDILDPDAAADFDIDSASWSCRAVGAGLLEPAEAISREGNQLPALSGAASVAWSPPPDDLLAARVYATGVLGNSLVVLEIDEGSGEMTVESVVDQGASIVDGNGDSVTLSGLRGARGLAVGAGGRFIYVSSQVDDRISVFEVYTAVDPQDESFGELRLVGQWGPQLAGLEPINQPVSLTLSPDGEHLYAASSGSGAIHVFSVDSGDGSLAPVEVIERTPQNGLGGVSGLRFAPPTVDEADYLYAAGTNDSALSVFRRESDGTLTHLQTRSSPGTPGLVGIADIAMDAGGNHIYAVGRDDNALVVFDRINEPGEAQFGRIASGIVQRIDAEALGVINSPRAVAVSADGGSLYVAAFGSNSLLAFGRDRQTGEVSFLTRYRASGDRADLAGVSSMAFDGSGETLFAGALADSAVTRLVRSAPSRCEIDSGSGNVVLDADIAAGGSILIDLAVDVRSDAVGKPCPESLDPERLCVINRAEITLDQDEQPDAPGDESPWRDSDASFLDRAADLVVTKTDGLAAFRGLAGARSIAVTEVGNAHAYVAAPGEPGIGIYSLEPDEGGPTGDYPLTFLDYLVNGEDGVSALTGIGHVLVSPDGRHLYATSRLDSAVVAFERDVESGALSVLAVYSNNTGGVSEISGTEGLAMSAGGEHLYVVGSNSNAIVVFDRVHDTADPDFGRLAFRQSLQNGTGDVQDMLAPVDLALSADGRHVYVAAEDSDAIVVFRRNHDSDTAGHGELSWLQSRRNLSGGVSGLAGVTRVRASADGRAVYAAGSDNDSLVWFDREDDSDNELFGRLSFAGRSTDGEDGAQGLAEVSDLALLDDDLLAATSPASNSVALYQRDPDSQALTFLDWLVDGGSGSAGPIAGLAGSRAVAAAGAGRILAASASPGAVASIGIDADALAFEGALIEGQGGAVPGDLVEYVITVHNRGPSRVVNARLSDQFPTQFESVDWSCEISSPSSSCPVAGGTGNIEADISVGAGDTVRFFADALMRPDASGTAVNEAVVSLPSGVVDLDPDSNTARDDDTVVRAVADLAVSIEDLPAQIQAGSEIEYRLRVSNLGSSNAREADVIHLPPEAFSVESWSCSADREPGRLDPRPAPPPELAAYRAAVVSSDGRHVYAVGDTDTGTSAVAMFSRDGLSGSLQPQQVIENLDDATDPQGDPLVVDGLGDARSLLLSPDGAHLYVAGYGDDAVAVFSRDAFDGALSYVGLVRDGIDSDALAGPRALAMGADGEQLYVAASLDDAISVLERDPASGALDPVQVRRNGIDGVSGLVDPVDVQIGAGGTRLLVAARGSDAMVQFGLLGDGSLENGPVFVDGETVVDGDDSYPLTGLAGVRSLAVAQDGETIYALSRDGSEHALVVFERLSDTVVRPASVLVDGDLIGDPAVAIEGLAQSSALALNSGDEQLYVVGTSPDESLRSVSAFGSPGLEGMQFLGRFDGSAVADATQAVGLATAPLGGHVYLLGGAGEAIDHFEVLGGSRCGRTGSGLVVDSVSLESGGEVIYDITARVGANARGDLVTEAGVTPGEGLLDPERANNLAVAPATIVAEAALAVEKTLQTDPVVAGEPVTWTIDITNHGPGTVWGLDVSDELPALPGDQPAPGAPGIVAGSASWFCEGTSQLAVSQTLSEPLLQGASGAVFSSDGQWAAATGASAGTLTLYSRNPSNGWLTQVATIAQGDVIEDEDGDPVGEVTGLEGAGDLWIAPDNDFIYVTAAEGDAVSWFEIDAEAGELRFAGRLADGDSTGLSLKRPARLLADARGDLLYVAARDSSAVTVLERDRMTGGLDWLESRRSGIGLPNNLLDGVIDLAISPDQRFVYAAASMHNGLAIFERNADGTLAYSGRLRNGDVQGDVTVTGLGLVQSIAVSAQGQYLYAAALADDSVTLFERDADSGELVLAEHYRDGFGGMDDLDGANAVSLSPDGEHLYLSARNDGVISIFDRDWSSGEIERIEKLALPEIAGLRRLVIAPEGGHLLATSDYQSGSVVNLLRRPEGYCGIDTLQADSLFDQIDLAAGASLRYTVDALVHPGARGELENTASAELPAGYAALSPGDQVDTAGGTIEVVTDLTIDKRIDGDSGSLVAGNDVTYVLDVSNLGPSHAFAAEVIDDLPDDLLDADWTCQTIPADSAGSDCAAQGSGDLFETVDLLVDERLLFLVTGRIAPDLIGQLENVAEVAPSADASDPDAGSNVDSVTASVSAAADVVVGMTALAAEAVPGGTIEFEITVENIGPSDAPGVALSDQLPAPLSAQGWSCSAQAPATCPVASGSGLIDLVTPLPADGVLTFLVEANVAGDAVPGEVIASAEAQPLGTEVGDPEPGNNMATASVMIVESLADLVVTKTVDRDRAMWGDLLTYQVLIVNDGPGAAASTAIVDVMPTALENVAWDCAAASGASCPSASGSGDIDFTVDLPAGASLSFEVTGQVIDGVALGTDELIVNEVSATSGADDPDDSNNLATAVTVLDRHLIFSDRFEPEEANSQSEDES